MHIHASSLTVSYSGSLHHCCQCVIRVHGVQVLFNHVILDSVPSDNLLEGFEGQFPGNPVTVTLTNSIGGDLQFTTSGGDLFVTDPGTHPHECFESVPGLSARTGRQCTVARQCRERYTCIRRGCVQVLASPERSFRRMLMFALVSFM